MDLRGRAILVTGAGGFVGPHLIDALARAGARSSGLGIEDPPDGLALAGWHPADLRDTDAMRAAVRAARPDAVVHLAGQSSAARSFQHPVETFEINVRGTWHLLEAVRAEAPGARVLVVASGEIYGSLPEGSRAKEDHPLHPLNPYGFSKAAADALAESYGRAHGLDVVRTRSFNHTGPGQDGRFVLPSFARQIAEIESGGGDGVLRVGNLDVVRDFSDVRDVARAYAGLVERGAAGAAYNVCSGRGVRLVEVVEKLVALARAPVRIERDPARMRPADIDWLVGDPGKIERELGWRAEIPLEETLAAVLEDARRSN